MAPSAIQEEIPVIQAKDMNGGLTREPLKPNGKLEQFEYFDVTPAIGREFPNANLAEWLRAPNSDELLKEFALTISQRGVVFFRAQNEITNDLQNELAQRLGGLSGKPATSKLHIHPISNSAREHGVKDDEISVISSEQNKNLYKNGLNLNSSSKKQSSKKRGTATSPSGYEVYDRISPPLQKFLDTLTATFAQPNFNTAANNDGFKLYTKERGAHENVGEELIAEHPVIRTNPVTGWKSVFAVGHHVQKINGLTEGESKHFLDWFVRLIVDNHDLQVRHRWVNTNDLAIWDNRSVYHAATPDYDGPGERKGSRAVSLDERPYFDPNSKSRREDMGIPL